MAIPAVVFLLLYVDKGKKYSLKMKSMTCILREKFV